MRDVQGTSAPDRRVRQKDSALEEMAEEAEQASSHKLSRPTIGVPRGDRIFVVMYFEIIGDIRQPETIAVGTGVRARKRLSRVYGQGRWRKRKGFARVRLPTGDVREAEVHWYEASGIGRRELKIKRYLHPSNEP